MHLLIDDPYAAIQEAKSYLQSYPESQALKIALINALCRAGKEIEALEEWKLLTLQNQGLLHDRVALEILAWGVLNKGALSNQLAIKVNALLGASMTKDAKAIPLLIEALRGSNSLIRSVAVGLGASYGDFPLQAEIARLLKEERVWHVRLELIKAIGQLRMKELKEELLKIIAHPRTLAEEKFAAIVSLVNMYESIEDKELLSLINSNRAGLRELACQIVSHLNLYEKVDLLFPLLTDTHPQVRIAMLNTLSLLAIKEIKGKPILQWEKLSNLLEDPIAEVAITAGFLALINGEEKGEKKLASWILGKESKYARLAAGALAISGSKGTLLSQQMLKKTQDPYVQVTLAMGLIGQRKALTLACQTIEKALLQQEKWMFDTSQNPLFRSLAPSKISHNPQIPNYPQIVDQLARIELLQLLCVMQYPKAQDSIKKFLQTNTWGVVGAACATLLQEGDEDALDVIRSLLNDPEEKVRIQAALILALLGADKAAVETLKQAYPTSSREVKIHILEALAKVGDPNTMEFLIERLNEPFQVLRVVAATAIIKCLYH